MNLSHDNDSNFNFPADWNCDKLGNVVNLVHGYQFRTTDFTSNGIPIIKIGNVIGGHLKLDDLGYIAENRFEEFKQYQIKNGDILMSLTGNIGRVVEVKNLILKLLQNYRVGKFEPINKNVIEKKYIKFLLSSD